MAPEQVSAEGSLDHRVDIYALGIVAYELLVGEPPFTDRELGPLLVAHATREPVPIGTRRPEVPLALADLVDRCLRKDPGERWSSAEALCAALRAATAPVAVAASARREPSEVPGKALEDLGAAREALDRRDWREAFVRFSAAGATRELEAEDLERLAEAAWWLADPACLRAREQAYRSYRKRGQREAAARVALALAEDHYHRLARSVAQGWLQRAERDLEGLAETATHGWLERLRMLLALEVARDVQTAMKHAERVLEIARRTGDTDLEALAIQDRGPDPRHPGPGRRRHGADRRLDDVRHLGRADPTHRRPHLLQHDQHLRVAGRLRPRGGVERGGSPLDGRARRLRLSRHLPGAPGRNSRG